MPLPNHVRSELKSLLERRLEIIADHSWRDRDATSHLEALKEVSLKLESLKQSHSPWPGQLRHYLDQASYQKALAYLDEKPE